MKKTKKLICVFLAMVMLISCVCVFASAESENEGNYPFIMVHGLGGWGQYEEYNEESPYWGGGAGMTESGGDIIEFLKDNGYEAYAASVGPVSSAWDRACELYAQLTGTVVDYGQAHSNAHNHDRYGESFEGRALMGEEWDITQPLNLVGHSFGGPAVRLFASLMAYGDEDEIAATGSETSPLFTGGHSKSVHSVVTLSGVHNGSPIANLIHDTVVPMYAIAFMVNVMSALKIESPMGSVKMGHFGLTPKSEDDTVRISPKKISTFVKAKDNAGYDLTLHGSQELNEKIKMSPDTYYYSYSVYVTEKNCLGFQKMGNSASIFQGTGTLLCMLQGTTIDGIKIDEEWAANDGMVPLASAKYPLDEADNAVLYEEAVKSGEALKTGVWYYREPIFGMDHGDFCNTGDDYPQGYENFYLELAKMANA